MARAGLVVRFVQSILLAACLGLLAGCGGSDSAVQPALIVQQPVDVAVVEGGSATFSVSATGDGLSYQWQISSNGTAWSDVAGANGARLVIASTTLAMNGTQYRVVVSGGGAT